MADPLQVLSSLDTLADHYAVFEPDQVLTHGQLNSVADFLGDQLRLSRVALNAVGLVAGLHVSLSDGGVRITRGLGVSTDGDLMRLLADTLYDRFRPYDRSAPVYRPFYRDAAGAGAPSDLLELHELVPVGESDVLARPLPDLDGGLGDLAVLMLAETVVNDPDLCSGTDCDNLGRDALHRLRLLLIRRRDAQTLLERRPLQPTSERAQALPALAMRRPALSREITTTTLLADRYRDAVRATLDDLQRALPMLARACPEVLADMFGSDPTSRWLARLNELAASADAASQVGYGFAKDLVDQWNELREALLADDAVLLPEVAAFPKHLLLGALAAPRELRSGLYPSPLDASARQQSAHARFLAWKLDVLIASYARPADTALRITPSQGEDRPLEERAIPWHYRVLDTTPIHVAWSFRLSSRHQPGQNLGYRAAAWAASAQVRDPLAFSIGRNDFFRIEGHLGRAVESVRNELRTLITERNLPFQVEAVLLHNRPERIRVRPGFRHTPLHSLHYLVRQDVALRLGDSVRFGQRQVSDLTEAVTHQQIPGSTDSGASLIGAAQAASQAVTSARLSALPVLNQPSYSAYQAAAGSSAGAAWQSNYTSSLMSLTQTRASLGHVSRVDFVSPFDSLISTNQPQWIAWLDELIADQGRKADARLLLPRFVQDHPGIDHLGGVWRGGTFVLVYDDQGRVVADFTLPYPAAQADEAEPEDPALPSGPGPSVPDGGQLGEIRPRDGGIRFVRPVDLVVKDRLVVERETFKRELDIQQASIEGLVKGALVPRTSVDAGAINPVLDRPSGNRYLDVQTKELAHQRDRVLELQGLLTEAGIPSEVRTQVEQELGQAQLDLAGTLGSVAEQFVGSGIPADSAAGIQMTQVMTSSIGAVQSSAAKTQLDSKLKTVQTQAVGGQAAVIGGLRKVGGF